jgi:hypothetical protein
MWKRRRRSKKRRIKSIADNEWPMDLEAEKENGKSTIGTIGNVCSLC